VVIGYIAGGTKTIRVGSGGVMLPNHAPLVIAEQFGTLESLYEGRIDLGLGRAPGTDRRTARALRRDLAATAENFPHDVMELRALLGPVQPNQMVRAVPGAGLRVPIWLLGSSTFSAQLAAMLGLPFAFASHFAPAELLPALRIYRTRFQPSEQLQEPYAMVGVNVSRRIPIPRRDVLLHRCNSSSLACDAARPGLCRRRSITWMTSGRASSGRELSRRWLIRWWALRTPSSGGWKRSSPRPRPTS
jgi:hypothetical protein